MNRIIQVLKVVEYKVRNYLAKRFPSVRSLAYKYMSPQEIILSEGHVKFEKEKERRKKKNDIGNGVIK